MTAKQAQFRYSVVNLGVTNGWRVYCRSSTGTRFDIGSSTGFPEIVMLRGSILLFRVLTSGKLKPLKSQCDWISELHQGGYDAKIWKPSDMPEIEAVLTG